MLDLHTHTTASDGTYSPANLIRLAKKIQLHAVAVCDHDTTDGIDEAILTANELNQTFVPGVELSATHRGIPVHLVGLYIAHKNSQLQTMLSVARKKRNDRNPKIVAALRELGIDISLSDVEKFASGESVGRPHFAAALQSIGAVKTFDEAFERYLGTNGRAYITRERLDAQEAISTIRQAGGVPILAHPHFTRLGGSHLEKFTAELKDLGLLGIETFYPGYTSSVSSDYTRLATRLGLVRSGGSDFHGDCRPKIRLGRGPGNLYVRDDLLRPIRELATSEYARESSSEPPATRLQ